MHKIATDQLHHLKINSEYTPLSDKCIGNVIKITVIDTMANAMNISSPIDRGQFSISTLYRDIDWRWMADRGTLAKRINKWFYDRYKVKLTSLALSAIGNEVRQHIVKDQEYHIDFTEKFDWVNGQFSDSGSCFWQDRTDIRAAMENSKKFLAIRFFRRNDVGTFMKHLAKVDKKNGVFYQDEDRYTYTGIARAFIAKDIVQHKDFTTPIWILFNGYGIATKEIATIAAAFQNQSIKRIEITNNGKNHAGLYTNGSGYLIGPESVIKDKVTYDFGVPYKDEVPEVTPGFSGKKLAARKSKPAAVDRFMQQAFLRDMDLIFANRPRAVQFDDIEMAQAGGILQYIPQDQLF